MVAQKWKEEEGLNEWIDNEPMAKRCGLVWLLITWQAQWAAVSRWSAASVVSSPSHFEALRWSSTGMIQTKKDYSLICFEMMSSLGNWSTGLKGMFWHGAQRIVRIKTAFPLNWVMNRNSIKVKSFPLIYRWPRVGLALQKRRPGRRRWHCKWAAASGRMTWLTAICDRRSEIVRPKILHSGCRGFPVRQMPPFPFFFNSTHVENTSPPSHAYPYFLDAVGEISNCLL